MNEKTAHMTKPLVLAYIGDSVYELYIRERLAGEKYKNVNDLHRKTVRYVKASAQAAILKQLENELTERELDVVRFGRNAHSGTVPKNAELLDYRAATGFEALIGYLRLSGQEDRLKVLLDAAYEYGKDEHETDSAD